eukprot:TRINITY_DN11510_c0_g1_i1.p1 TRINITY_DN11510_c0_g1~~TRINITY_DN11510_c0_g1_i1.p1  ORF type:complete len:698 (-),score=166.94 TRINITY_DN11510_c0_g1_i1:220-2178(-)
MVVDDAFDSGFQTQEDEEVLEIDGIYGIYELPRPYIALIMESQLMFEDTASGIEFRQATRIGLLQILAGSQPLSAEQHKQEQRALRLLRWALHSHTLLFSHTHHVTHSQQRAAALLSTDGGRGSDGGAGLKQWWRQADQRFFWNARLVSRLIEAGADEWVCPVICGHVTACCNCRMGGEKFTLLLVTRRSRHAHGARYIRRGAYSTSWPEAAGGLAQQPHVEEKSSVAVSNFVETEMVVLMNRGGMASHVQVRGSIPIGWASLPRLTAKPLNTITADRAANAHMCQQHMTELRAVYGGDVVVLNLVDSHGDQGRLGQAFQAAVDAPADGHEAALAQSATVPKAAFVWYALNSEWEKQAAKPKQAGAANAAYWQVLHKLGSMMEPYQRQEGWYGVSAAGEVLSVQAGVTRSNCMDCCDRTAAAQCLLARTSLRAMLNALLTTVTASDTYPPSPTPPTHVRDASAEQLLPDTSGNSSGIEMRPMGASSAAAKAPVAGAAAVAAFPEPLETLYVQLWRQSADEVSSSYAGSRTLKLELLRVDAQRTVLGSIIDAALSTQRYMVNHCVDALRQRSMDIMLGEPAAASGSDGAAVSAITAVTVFSARVRERPVHAAAVLAALLLLARAAGAAIAWGWIVAALCLAVVAGVSRARCAA